MSNSNSSINIIPLGNKNDSLYFYNQKLDQLFDFKISQINERLAKLYFYEEYNSGTFNFINEKNKSVFSNKVLEDWIIDQSRFPFSSIEDINVGLSFNKQIGAFVLNTANGVYINQLDENGKNYVSESNRYIEYKNKKFFCKRSGNPKSSYYDFNEKNVDPLRFEYIQDQMQNLFNLVNSYSMSEGHKLYVLGFIVKGFANCVFQKNGHLFLTGVAGSAKTGLGDVIGDINPFSLVTLNTTDAGSRNALEGDAVFVYNDHEPDAFVKKVAETARTSFDGGYVLRSNQSQESLMKYVRYSAVVSCIKLPNLLPQDQERWYIAQMDKIKGNLPDILRPENDNKFKELSSFLQDFVFYFVHDLRKINIMVEKKLCDMGLNGRQIANMAPILASLIFFTFHQDILDNVETSKARVELYIDQHFDKIFTKEMFCVLNENVFDKVLNINFSIELSDRRISGDLLRHFYEYHQLEKDDKFLQKEYAMSLASAGILFDGYDLYIKQDSVYHELINKKLNTLQTSFKSLGFGEYQTSDKGPRKFIGACKKLKIDISDYVKQTN